MGWEIVLGDTTINETNVGPAKFSYREVPSFHENGRADFVEVFCDIEGDVKKSTASLTADKFFELIDEAGDTFNARDLTLKLDGVTKREILAADAIEGPRVSVTSSIEADGNGDSHWRYEMSIYAKIEGNNVPSDLVELDSSITTSKVRDKVVKKIWRVRAKSKDVATALSLAMNMKPNSQDLKEDLERRWQSNEVVINWEWSLDDAAHENGILSCVERIRVSNLGAEYVEDLVAGENPQGQMGFLGKSPVLHRARRRVITIKVEGTIFFRVAPGEEVVPPDVGPHFTESTTLKRAGARETNDYVEARLVDLKRGIFAWDFEEVWLATDSLANLNPNHGDHSEVVDIVSTEPSESPVPADGPMSSNQ